MRPLPFATLAALAIAGAAIPLAAANAGDPEPQPMAFRAEAKVTLDAAGKPLAIEPSEDLPAPIRDFIRQRVATWHFSPPEQDGVTGPAVTYLRLGACALPEPGGGYRLAVDYKGNGPLYANGPLMMPPDYPKAARIRGIETAAKVVFVIGTDGRATLEGIDYDDKASHRSDGFDTALRDWVRAMRYEPEQLAGHPVRTRVGVPVTFRMAAPDFTREALREKAAKSEECRLAAGATPQPGLEPVALNSPVRIEPAG
jgi:TonB family protein